MTNSETRRYEMSQRIREFGETHRDLFPAQGEGAQALEIVAAAVRLLGEHAVSKMSVARGGKRAKALARQALKARLDAIARSARVIAAAAPMFDDPFEPPRQRSDQALLTAGRGSSATPRPSRAGSSRMGCRRRSSRA